MLALAVKYRPQTWEELVGQDIIKTILTNQLKNNNIRNAYLFVGGAGTGKTTSARLFAKELDGTIIEIDGASNNGVDNVREIDTQARTRSITGKYKIFIIDECHMITTQGWNAMLKLIEEPPENTIFIFCTTNPEKIPETIMSRVQRYNFNSISEECIVLRLIYICNKENFQYEENAIEYIAKKADGHMRNAITILDKCSNNLTVKGIVDSMDYIEYETYDKLLRAVKDKNETEIIKIIEDINYSGRDLKQFIDGLLEYLLDYSKLLITDNMTYCSCPKYCKTELLNLNYNKSQVNRLLNTIINVKNDIKYSDKAKIIIETNLLLFINEEG